MAQAPRNPHMRQQPIGGGYSGGKADLSAASVTQESREEAARLLSFALFNLTKGKTNEAKHLLHQAYKELTGEDWDG